MEDSVASVTAMATARMRAIHTRRDPQPVLDDPWGDRLVPPDLVLLAMAGNDPDRVIDSTRDADGDIAEALDDVMHSSVAFTNVILRAALAEDVVNAALAGGVRQYVLLGAGFDSYALRLPAQARDAKIIEIDHPATQSFKLERMRDCGLGPPSNVHFVAADLARDTLDNVLAASPFDAEEPAIFAWLGVTMYLTREANMATLASVARCSAPGSELVFNYVDQKWFEEGEESLSERYAELSRDVHALGEPFISGFHPEELAGDLAEVGLELLEDMDEFQMMARYDPDAVNGFKPIDRSHVALARVAGRTR